MEDSLHNQYKGRDNEIGPDTSYSKTQQSQGFAESSYEKIYQPPAEVRSPVDRAEDKDTKRFTQKRKSLWNAVKGILKRDNYTKTLIIAASSLGLMFFLCGIWIFGCLHDATSRAYHLEVLKVNFDDGIFARSLDEAVDSINGLPTVPTFIQGSTDIYTNIEDVKHAIWKGNYWAAIVSNPGMSTQFNGSLQSESIAESYEPSQVYTYIYSSVRYFTAFQQYVNVPCMGVLEQAKKSATVYGLNALLDLQNTRDTEGSSSLFLSSKQTEIIAQPSDYSVVDLAPFTFNSRVLVNTVNIVFFLIVHFSFGMTLNSILTKYDIYRTKSLPRLIQIQYLVKILWTLITGLLCISFPRIFKENWDLPTKNFIQLWMISWLFNWITYNSVWALLTFIPPHLFGLFDFPFIIISSSATMIPIELSNQFYRINYAIPAHAFWEMVITIYGQGVSNRTYIHLPILFAWLVLTEPVFVYCQVIMSRRGRKVN